MWRSSPPREIGIVGTGLVGASVGLRARALSIRTLGYDARPEHLALAAARGAIDRSAGVEECASAEIVVVATPLEPALEILAGLRSATAGARLVLDVCSVKVPVARLTAGWPNFVPTHPMAGSERSGPEAALPDLFAGCVWMHAPADEPVRQAVRDFIRSMGAKPLELDPREHDRIVALTSALPQLLSIALADRLGRRLDEPAVKELCGPGMRSMLRLASSSWPMWQGILAANRDAAAQEVRGIAAILSEFACALEVADVEALGTPFAEAARVVQRVNESSER